MCGAIETHRAEQQPLQSAEAPSSEYKKVGRLGSVEQHIGRMTSCHLDLQI